MKNKKNLLILGAMLCSSALFASGGYQEIDAYPIGKCRLATEGKTKDIKYLSKKDKCVLSLLYYNSDFSSAQDLTSPIPNYGEFKAKYWLEKKVNGSWLRISNIGRFVYNGTPVYNSDGYLVDVGSKKKLEFVPKTSGTFRVAFDYYGQKFADTYSDEYKIFVK